VALPWLLPVPAVLVQLPSAARVADAVN